jgi:hypothetical protein
MARQAMTIDEATQILRDQGYQVFPLPMPRPGYLWMSDEPNSGSFDAYSESDVITLAEALHNHHCCYYCGERAESQCPLCQRWTCWEDRRDWPPDFDQHWCPGCVGKHNAVAQATLAAKASKE